MNEEFSAIRNLLEADARYSGDLVNVLSKLGLSNAEILDFKTTIAKDVKTKEVIEKLLHVIYYDSSLLGDVVKQYKQLK